MSQGYLCVVAERVNNNANIMYSYGMHMTGNYDCDANYNATGALPSPVGYFLPKVKKTSTKFLVADGFDWWLSIRGGNPNTFYWSYLETYNASRSMETAYRHGKNNTANIAFFDSHVESRNYQNVYTDKPAWFPYKN